MNLGGEPERDDSGLPPVDIVVPDDARELERDVQAYRREQRALRRQQRRVRWHGPLTRDGVVLPLLASCLILALIAGTLLTFFTARPGGDLTAAAPKARSSSPAASTTQPGSSATPGDSPSAVVSAKSFPAQAVIAVGGQAVPRPDLTGAVFALVPADCACASVLGELIAQAAHANVNLYLVGGGQLATDTYITALVKSVDDQGATVAQDAHGTLATTYLRPAAMAQGSNPSALLVDPDGTVSVAAGLPDGFRLTSELNALAAKVSAAPAAGGG